jgi:AcrR family transcriptional regulator
MVLSMPTDPGPTSEPERPDRRARRRQQTIDEILEIAEQIMTEEGVNGLSLSEIARRLGVQPPSLYKYFPSLMAIYDELFRRGQIENLTVLRDGMAGAEPGLAALAAGLDACGRWAVDHRAMQELLFLRPIPGFEPSPGAFEPSQEMFDLHKTALAAAVANGEIGAGGDSDKAVYLVSCMFSGVVNQAAANEPDLPWGEGRFTPLFPVLLDLLPTLFPPLARRTRRTRPTARASA